MEGSTRDGAVEVSFFVRADLPGPSARRADAVREELRSLASADVLDGVAAETWPKRVPVDRCDSAVRDVYLEWTAWARAEGVTLQPFFDTRECYCPEAEDYTDWLVVPTMAVAVRSGDDLVAVYPHADDGDSVTVEDGLGHLAATERRSADARLGPAD